MERAAAGVGGGAEGGEGGVGRGGGRRLNQDSLRSLIVGPEGMRFVFSRFCVSTYFRVPVVDGMFQAHG